jgi:outer membrane lipoprotein-sorting protein
MYVSVTAFVLGLVGQFVHAQQSQAASSEAVPSVVEIVEKSNRVAYYQGKNGRAEVAMTITDSQGRTRSRQFVILRRDAPSPSGDANDAYCGDQKFYVYFRLPADVNKMVFMVWKHVGEDDDRWLYLPALDLVKRIAAAEKRTSFVGSDFFYEDVSGRDIDADEHELVESSENYYVLKNTPKEPDSVEFAYYRMWVHRQTFVTVKVEYYDKNGEKYREYEALGVKTIDGYPTVIKAQMKDLRTGGNTVIEYSNVKYNIDLPEDIFTERYLRRPPLKYLR